MLTLVLVLLAQPLPPNHPPPNGRAPSADELIQKLDSTAGLKEKEKPFEIAASLGRLYFGQGRYADAQTFYKQALAQAEEPRALYDAQRKLNANKPLPTPDAAGCTPNADATLAKLVETAKKHVASKSAGPATVCLKVALTPLLELDVMYGHTQFLLGDSAGAIATYSRALGTFESNSEARYARAAATLDTQGDDVAALNRAKADFTQFLAEAPTSPRAGTAKRLLARTDAALAAGGLSKSPVTAEQIAALTPQDVHTPKVGQPPVITPEMAKQFQDMPRTPEMEANFKKLIDDAEEHLAKGRFQDALTAYKQVMPFQPENTRLRAGMAWTMVKLNRQPMADNVWRVATQDPDAVAALGDTLKSKGDAEGARALWLRLKDSVPAYGPKLDGRL